jgi:hypothetical protein
MRDNAVTGKKHVEPRFFDPDDWGASPRWESGAGRSVYDECDLDREQVPRARSLFADRD